MEIKSTHKGDFNVSLDSRTRITLRCSGSFTLATTTPDGEILDIIAPNNANDRYAQLTLDGETYLSVLTEGVTTLIKHPLAERGETPDPNSLCEVVPDEKLSMYERLKAEMFQAISSYADQKGLDTFEDDDDHTFADDDSPLIDTPYEYIAMQDEILAQAQIPEPTPQPLETPAEPVEPTPEPEPTPAS